MLLFPTVVKEKEVRLFSCAVPADNGTIFPPPEEEK